MSTAFTNSMFSVKSNIPKLGHGAEVRACYPILSIFIYISRKTYFKDTFIKHEFIYGAF